MAYVQHRRPLRAVHALLALGLAALIVVAPPATPPAAAHAALVRSSPVDGARLDKPPGIVTLTFTEDVRRPAYVVVTAPDGTRASAGDADPAGSTVTQRLESAASDQSAGRWTIAYRVVSVDGHPVSGELAFSVRATPEDTAPEDTAPGDTTTSTPSDGTGEPTADNSTAAATDMPSGVDDEPVWQRHAGLLTGVGGAFAAAVVLLAWPLKRRGGG